METVSALQQGTAASHYVTVPQLGTSGAAAPAPNIMMQTSGSNSASSPSGCGWTSACSSKRLIQLVDLVAATAALASTGRFCNKKSAGNVRDRDGVAFFDNERKVFGNR
ncbi:unnamed protein product [Symbiodinium natans]|uniref:Uncharacterized protein n=1 Tax=Symbiodinium natans TaxID=878477 RepID=A0A812VIX9_9DINO|nr:unnamed protein product [Symbiodinium natans]